MARIRRRRPKVVWLPDDLQNRIGQTGTAINGGVTSLGGFIVDTFGPLGTVNTAIVPVVRDEPQPAAFFAASLSDLENSSYRLRRIVGKIWWAWEQGAGVGTQPAHGIVTTGFIVLKCKPDGSPIGNPPDYNPGILNNTMDPWIWRRSWWLGNFELSVITGLNYAPPEANYLAGSVLDGPHIDQKTARIVGPEERLFMVSSIVCTDIHADGLNPTQVQCNYDLRVLASMRNSQGNRGNSSR